MTSIVQFLSDLRSLGVILSVDHGRLRCSAPKGVVDQDLREQITERKQEIVAFLLRTSAYNMEFQADGEVAKLPLSRAQRRLWFIDQVDSGNPAYHIVLTVKLTGSLDRNALNRSLQVILDRHETLRTSFDSTDGKPFARVHAGVSWNCGFVDLSLHSASDAQEEARKQALEVARRPFVLTDAPLFRAVLFCIDPGTHLLVLVIHHIVADGWSLGILTRELSALYAGFVVGEQPALPPLSTKYRDFVRWEEEMVSGTVSQQLPFWIDRLRGPLPVLDLSSVPRQSAIRSSSGRRPSFFVDPGLSEAIRSECRARGVAPFMFFLAVFNALLFRYTGQHDILVTTHTANRQRREFESLLGFFVNNLVLRSAIGQNPEFRELLSETKETALSAFANQDVPFDLLVEKLHIDRDLSRNPLTQAAFTLHNWPIEPLVVHGLEFEFEVMDLGTARTDLALEVWPDQGGFRCYIEYSTDLFDDGFAHRFEEHYLNFLREVIVNPAIRIEDVPIVSPQERQQLLVQWNETDRPYPNLPVHQIFEELARTESHATALISEDVRLSYGELDRIGNVIASRLAELRLPAHSFVAVAAPGSVLGIAAFLGVLKAGLAYCAVSPTDPPQRLRQILDHAGISVLLTTQDYYVGLRESGIPHTELLEEIAVRPNSDFAAPAVNPDDPACLMYTSGSSGLPKGVVIPHRGIVRLVCGIDYARLGPGEVLLQICALPFDASTLEIWGALLNRSSLVVLRTAGPTPEQIGKAISLYGVSTLICTAALFHFLVSEHIELLQPLRQMLIGGDVLSPYHVEQLLRAMPHLQLVNCYGPTENSTNTTYEVLSPQRREPYRIPIGRPVPNTKVFVLDSRLRPVPIGVTGELYAAGDGLALGYLNAPEVTQERFLTVPFDEIGSVRMYQTGDLARYRSDGRLEFMGRVDNQIKLHGYRIEPGEVEQALLQLPAVRAAVVSVRTWPDGDRRLVAFVVPERESAVNPGELRDALRSTLPRQCIPAAFIPISDIPRTANGKIDCQSLDEIPIPAQHQITTGQIALTRTEERIRDFYRELLQSENVSADDDFFSLGGHSLLAMQLLSRITHEFQVDLRIVEVFQNPTVRSLAGRVEAAGPLAKQSSDSFQNEPRAVASAEHSLSRSQLRLWFMNQLDPGNPLYRIAVAFVIRGSLNRVALADSLRLLVARHESLRTHFEEREGNPFACVENGSRWEMEYVDTSTRNLSEEEFLEVLHKAVAKPFDISRGFLFRASLFRKSADEYCLLLSMHHIISDGWSLGLLVTELAQAYGARTRGMASPELHQPATQFREFVRWEQSRTDEKLETDLAYWREKLGGELPVLELPADFPRPPVQAFQGRTCKVQIPATLSERLQDLARREHSTLFMVLLSGFTMLLRQYSRQEDILVGTPSAGRRGKDFEGTVGFIADNLVLRANLEGNPAFRDLLGRVRAIALEAFEHQSVSFEQLVESLQPDRSLDRSPIFQVMFALQNLPLPKPELADLGISVVDLPVSGARYDLAVDIAPFGGDLLCSFEYNTDLFRESTVRGMQERYIRLLERIADSPESELNRLSCADQEEFRKLTQEWNQTDADLALSTTIQSRFVQQAKKSPFAAAIRMGDRKLTYHELDRKSDLVAAFLRSHGVGTGTLVGIYMDRSPEMVVGLLAILKLRAAYLPIDPTLPNSRVEFLLEDSKTSIVLTNRAADKRQPETEATFVAIEDALRFKSPEPLVAERGGADDLAYVIYTSGSTGTPKGTEIVQSAVVNLLASMLREPGLTAEDTLLAITTLSFDIACLEIFGPLICGATVVLASPQEAVDPVALAELIDNYDVTVMQATPSSWRMLVESGWMGKADLRIWCGGEMLSPDLAENLIARGSELWNLYGPTETTIWSTVHRVSTGENPILIGRPIANTRIYILDRDGQPTPVGVPGEMYIGGAGLARGYRLQPELTNSRFVNDPFVLSGNGRMYRTGDLARYRSDGEIQLLGRIDQQIKLRGHRIEPAEIEFVLERHPDVLQAVVELIGEGSSAQLVAYIRTSADKSDTGKVRSWLQMQLPSYMVPGVLLVVSEIPLTASGKVDRRRLPRPRISGSDLRSARIVARSSTEEKLGELWADLLHIDRPGVRDNFFDLGGHSLLLVQLHARIKREFDTNVAVVDLFRYPTIEAFAAFLDERMSGNEDPVGVDAA